MATRRTDSAWAPVLTGTVAQRAGEAVQAIAERLREIPADWIPAGLPKAYRSWWAKSPSLASGRAGLAVLYMYVAQHAGRDRDREQAAQLLEEAIDLMGGMRMDPSLYGGFTGVAWVTEHAERLLGPAEEDPNAAIDGALLEYLGQSSRRAEYELVRGLAGLGVYALERLPRETDVECLQRVVDHLDETAERTTEGVTWFTPPVLLPPHQLAQCPHGHYNLGVAHGVPGVIALLGQVCAAGVAGAKSRELLDGAVKWLLAQKLPAGAKSCFPCWVGRDVEASPSRLAWCYGDPGIAATLLYAARCVGESSWEEEAIRIARRAAERAPDDAGVVDAGLCHGAAGLGHVFNRMHQATGDAQLGEAARFWFERTLELRRPGEGIGGFSAWTAAPDGEQGWAADPYFLTGAAGIGLALLAATTPLEPLWDRVLLVSIPPSTG